MEEQTGRCRLRCSNAVRLASNWSICDSPSIEVDTEKEHELTRDVAVVGAGIGGLATALALSRRGWPVQVFGRSAGLSEAGAGMQNLDP